MSTFTIPALRVVFALGEYSAGASVEKVKRENGDGEGEFAKPWRG